MGIFLSELGLSELCQKKTGFWEFLHSQGFYESIENSDDYKWRTHQELNLKPSDP
jgi:hypothetical protein